LKTKHNTDKARAEKMNTYYKVFISRSSKNVGSKEGYTVFDKQKYGNFKKVKMYQDGKNNEAIHCGWIYCFKDYVWEDGKKLWFWEQDWIEIKEVKETIILY